MSNINEPDQWKKFFKGFAIININETMST